MEPRVCCKESVDEIRSEQYDFTKIKACITQRKLARWTFCGGVDEQNPNTTES